MTILPSQRIRVMLVDDHEMVRKGLATFLKVFKDLQLAGEAESGAAAIQLCGEILPDVVLMDMVMPGWSNCNPCHLPAVSTCAGDCANEFQRSRSCQERARSRSHWLFTQGCLCNGFGESHPRCTCWSCHSLS